MGKTSLQWSMEECLKLLEAIDKEVDTLNLQNEQFVLNFYDKINEISIRK